MRLLDSLYCICSEQHTEGSHIFSIHLDSEHYIYKAHFPGEPITPGVCILQIAVELLEQSIGKSLQVLSVKNVKFLRIISPVESPDVTYNLQKVVFTDEEIKCQITVSHNENTFAKLSIVCRESA